MIYENKYSLEEIINDNNLIFNLRLDIIFKKVFLDSKSLPYIKKLIGMVYQDFNNELKGLPILMNGEIPNKNINKKSSRMDLVVRFNNIDFIIEMNHASKDYILEKNNSYLFNLHSSKINNANKYGKNIYTVLINIDDYDLLGENRLLYESILNYPEHNVCLYKNIKIKHINLEYLKKKYYNKGVKNMTYLEKFLLIFIEFRKDKIRKVIKDDIIEGVIEIMDKLKLDMKLPTYDGEEYERLERISFENKKAELNKYENNLNKTKEQLSLVQEIISKNQEELSKNQEELSKNQEELSKNQEELSKNQEELSKNQEEFNREKKIIVKEFKKLGLSIKRISELTKIPIEQIKTLL